jgi:tetratricopeptide (TPR) repeat protein
LALEDFKYAYGLNSTKYDAPFYAGVAHFHLEEYDSAQAYLNKATDVDSLASSPFYYRARINYNEDFYDAALTEINKALKIASEKTHYYVLRAKIYMFNENEYDDDMAIEDLNKAIKMGSEEAKELLAEYFSEGYA